MASRSPALWKPGLAVAALVAVTARSAHAYYEESHVTGDEARLTVDAAGGARIEHTLAWHLVAGQPRTIDLAGVEPAARLESSASIEAEDGRMAAATVGPLDGRGVRVTITDPKSLRHGHYRVRLAYDVDLAASGELVRDGASFRLLWKGPIPREGYDAAKVTFALPGALEEPRAIVGEGAMPDDGVMSALKRSPAHDELTLVRPHVGKGEEAVWAVRVSARAFDAGRGVGRPAPPALPRLESYGHEPWVYAAILCLAAAFGALVREKERRFDQACKAFGAQARGLVPLRSWERGALAAAALFVGLSLQLADATVTGTVCVAFAMVCAALRPPRVDPLPRGPGLWLILRPEEVFGPVPQGAPRDWDGLVFAVAALVLLGAGHLLRSVQPEAPLMLPLDAVVLLPVVLTGRRAQLPPDLVGQDRRWFRRVFGRLTKSSSLHVSPWVRIPAGAATGDELRLLATARAPMAGLVGIEVGRSYVRTSSSFVSFPEVLVRVHEATAASARLTSLVPEVVPLPGRRPEERVYRLTPSWPTGASTAALVESLCQRLVDRRIVVTEWEAEAERRAPMAGPAEPAAAIG